MRDIKYRDDGRPEDLLQELGYETQDIQYKRFAHYAAFFFGFFVFCIIAGFFVMLWMSPTGWKGGRMADYKPKTDMPIAAPLLQTNITARTDIESLRQKETVELTTPAVEDQKHGTYRIPVEQAIDKIVADDGVRSQYGLPPSSAPAAGDTSISASGNGPSLNDRGESATTKPKGGKSGT